MKPFTSLIIVLLSICMIAPSCNNKKLPSQEAKPTSTKEITTGPDSKKPAAVEKTTSSSTQPPVKSQRRSASKSPSRSPQDIVSAFPFDIDLKDANGKVYKSDRIFKKNGKPTVLMFWLTTCAPCHMKMNALKTEYPNWKEEADFNLFAISGDYQKNYENFVSQVEKKAWEWETYNDWNREFRQVLPGNLNGYPQTFIFDKDGELVYQDKRYRTGDLDKLLRKIKEIGQS